MVPVLSAIGSHRTDLKETDFRFGVWKINRCNHLFTYPGNQISSRKVQSLCKKKRKCLVFSLLLVIYPLTRIMNTLDKIFFRGLFGGLLLVGALGLVGCDSGGSGMEDEPTEELDQISYDLEAQSNDGALSNGLSGTVTFWRAGNNQTLVTLELDDGATGTELSHPAHIHENSADEGGDIAFYLSPIDGTGGGGTSARLIDRPIEDLADFDGYVNIHESVGNLGIIVSQGNIGANAEGTEGDGLDLVDDPRSATYDLGAVSNNGDQAPGGIPGEVSFKELTSGQTLVTLTLNPGTEDGATGANVSHPAHIHNNTASEGGEIAEYLSPVDGSDSAARSSKIVEQSYDNLTSFDGYVNVHESATTLNQIVSQGNVGANAESGGGDDDGGY